MKEQQQRRPIISVDEFFYNDPNTPWKPLPEHDLKQSPCYPIIDIRRYHKYKIPFYYCKLHPDIENAYLEIIEHHCKYKEPNAQVRDYEIIVNKGDNIRRLADHGCSGG